MLTIKRWLHHDVSERGRGHPLLPGLRQLVSRLHHRSPETQAKHYFYLTINAKSFYFIQQSMQKVFLYFNNQCEKFFLFNSQ
jgi:hypothetical protein